MTEPIVEVHSSTDDLVAAAAEHFIAVVTEAQAERGSASVVLTGGGIGIATLRELASSPARDAVDWDALDVWWGDERFLPGGHPDRNETQAREALLDSVSLDPARVHPMAASDGDVGDDLDGAAERYAEELAKAARPEDHGPVPTFDVLLLGVGPDGHIASLFP